MKLQTSSRWLARILSLIIVLASLAPFLPSASPVFAVSTGNPCAWGNNESGQLGNNSIVSSSVLVQVSGLTGVAAFAGGASHSLAVKSDGTIWAWGVNSSGQLGDNTTTSRLTPVQVRDEFGTGFFTGAVSVAASRYNSMALKSDNTVWAWGLNDKGQLGNDDTLRLKSPIPVQVKDQSGTGFLSDVVAIAAGDSLGMALKSDGSVWTWGDSANGKLGIGGASSDVQRPVQVKDHPGTGFLSGITAIAACGNHSLALMSGGTVWAWGRNFAGELGDGTPNDAETPTQTTITAVANIAAGGNHSLAVKLDGTVWSWGYNSTGELGDNTITQSLTPVQVKDQYGTGFLAGYSSVAAGGHHSYALKSDGTVWAWGLNFYGELGNNSTTNSPIPVQVNGLAGCVTVASGAYHGMAIASSAAAEITAYSLPGQTGSATINSVAGTIGVTVPFSTNVTALAATFTTSANITSIKVGGTDQVSGTTTNNFTSPVTYVVTAQDGTTIKNWVVTVTVAVASSAAEIAAYSLPGQTGSATINSGAGTIGVTVPFGTNVTAMAPTFATSANSISVKVGGTDQVSGTTTNNFTSPVTYVVTAQDGTTIKNWVVTVTVAVASSDATPSGLTISSGTLTPVFDSGTTVYTYNVANAVTSVTVTPTLNESHATVTINGNSVASGAASGAINLDNIAPATNTITIVVTAQDAITTKTYTITVTRAAPALSSDANLSGLTISSGTLTPVFDSGTTVYTYNVANAVTSVTVTPTLNESHATVTINGNSVASGAASGAINLDNIAPATNTITIVVTAQDAITTKTYTITTAQTTAPVQSSSGPPVVMIVAIVLGVAAIAGVVAFFIIRRKKDKIVFTTGPQTIKAGAVSKMITIQIQDAKNNPAKVTGNTVIALSSSSSGLFGANGDGLPVITSVTIQADTSSASFYYKDSTKGSPTIIASNNRLKSGSQTETIN